MATINKKWWKNAIFYQIDVATFCDSDGDGVGDLLGIVSKLSYLKDLGIDALWLSPVFVTSASGYGISDFKAINPAYGTMDDMNKLISRAKRLGIKLILDISINHTSDEHPWFKRALEGDQRFKDFYYFRRNKNKPNNWKSISGGGAWEKLGHDEYYMHLLGKHQPELNWKNPAVYDEMVDIMRFWLDKGIAGFKLNYINLIYKTTLENGAPRLKVTGRENYTSAPGAHDLLHRLSLDVWNRYKAFVVGSTTMAHYGEVQAFTDADSSELHSALFFEEEKSVKKSFFGRARGVKPHSFISSMDQWQSKMQLPSNYIGTPAHWRLWEHHAKNSPHFQESTKLICGMVLSLKGIPWIRGYEHKDFEKLSRDEDNPDSLISFYKSMIDFRKSSEALQDGKYRRMAAPRDIYLFTREAPSQRLYIYCNMTSFTKMVELYGDEYLIGNYPKEEGYDYAYLRPFEFRIVKSNI